MPEPSEFPGPGSFPAPSFVPSAFPAAPPPPPVAPARLTPLLYELRPLSLGEILDRTFALYRKRFWLFAGLAVVASAVLTVGTFVQLTWGMAGRGFVLPTPGTTSTDPFGGLGMRAAIVTAVGSLVFSLLHLVAFAITQAATVSAVSDVYLGHETTIGEAFRAVRGTWLRYIGIVIWQAWSAMWLALALVVVAFGLLALKLTGLAVFLFVLAFLALIYGVIAYMRNSLGVVAAVVERLKVRAAMRRSKDLVKGRLWRVLSLLLLMYVLSMVAGVAQGTLGVFLGLSHGAQRAMLEALTLIATFITTSLVTPVGAIAFCLFYIDARVRDEGFDVETLMNRAVAEDPGAGASPFTSELA